MPYDNPGSDKNMNQWGQPMVPDGFRKIMDEVCTQLAYGSLWHKRLASQLRKIANRGEGRWFQDEGKGDYCNSSELEKLLGDNIDIYPEIDTSKLAEAVSFTLSTVQELKPLLMDWIKREYSFAATICESTRMASNIDPEIYDNLCCLWKETSMEAKRAKMLYKRCELAGWSGHDEGIVSMILHKHYENHPGDIEGNVNLG